MKIKTTDQPDRASPDWIKQLERVCADMPDINIYELFRCGGLFLLMDEIMRKKADA